jgi:ubiquinone/menaquinone biosynthesis C-methylase UbiE
MLSHMHKKPAQAQPNGSMQGWAASYDRLTGALFMGKEAQLRQATLDLAGLQPGDSLLEVGCGTGTLTLAAKARLGAESQVIGIDVAEDMLAAARRKASQAGLEITFQAGRIEQIPFPDGRFQVVLASLMIHHIPDPADKQRGFNEILRVLKPGGRLLIVDFEPPTNRILSHLVRGVLGEEMAERTVRELIPLATQAGFAGIESGAAKSRFLSFLRATKPE